MGSSERTRWRRVAIFVGLVLILVVVVRLIADPIATWAFRRLLDDSRDLDGQFKDVHVRFFPPGSTVNQLHLRERGERAAVGPALFAERVDSRLLPHRLFRDGVFAFQQTVTGMKLNVPVPLGDDTSAKAQAALQAVQSLAGLLPRTTVDAMQVRDGELLLTPRKKPEAAVWLHGIRMDAQLRSGPGREDSRTLQVDGEGTVQRRGRFALTITASEKAGGHFTVRQAVVGLPTAELYQPLEGTGLQAPDGTLSAFTSLQGRGERLTGRTRLEVRNLRVRETDEGLAGRLKAWVAQKAFDIAAEDQPGGGQVFRQTVAVNDRLDRRGSLFEDVVAALERATTGGWDALLRRGEEQGAPSRPVQGRTRRR